MGSFKTRGNFQKIRGLWPLIPATIAAVLNIDWVVIPALKSLDIPIYRLLAVAYVLSTLELKFWFWFWSWVAQLLIHTRKVKEGIALGKEIGTELKEKGYIARIKDFLFKIVDNAFDEKSRLVKFLKWGGGFSLVLIGASVESGSRVVGIIFCKMFNWKKGFYPLAFGNLIHVTYIVIGWKYLGIFQMVMLFFAIVILSYVVKKMLIKK